MEKEDIIKDAAYGTNADLSSKRTWGKPFATCEGLGSF
jgi:hypothetical protein